MAIDVESQGPNRDGGIVSRIVDGDTIEVETVTRTVTVRYIGVDAPERRDPYGKEAEAANGELIEGRRVCLEEDQSETDGYGRLLRYVHVDDGACDGTFVNAELVRRGLALAAYYPPDTRHLHLFARLQGEAVRGCRGLWSALPGCAGRAAFLPISHALAARPTGTAR